MTRAERHLVLSGATDLEKWPEPTASWAPRWSWIWRAVAPGLRDGDTSGAVPLHVELIRPDNVDEVLPERAPTPPAEHERAVAAEAPPSGCGRGTPPGCRSRGCRTRRCRPYKACGYRFYAERVLGLPRLDRAELGPPPAPRADAVEEATGQWALAPGEEPSPAVPSGLSALDRGSVVHELLERTDFREPAVPPPRR